MRVVFFAMNMISNRYHYEKEAQWMFMPKECRWGKKV